VYIPPTLDSSKKYPTVLAIHGGGLYSLSKQNASSAQELNEMPSRSWIVVAINYRLIPQAVLSDIMQDVKDAYHWIRNDLACIYPINPDSIIVFGGSAGGGLTLISGFQLNPRPKALISFYPGFADFTTPEWNNLETPVSPMLLNLANRERKLITEYQPSGPYDPRNILVYLTIKQGKIGWLYSTSDPNESSDQILAILKSFSAYYHVDDDYPPTYLIHGLKDSIVPYSQSVMMAEQLSAHGISHVLDLVPDQDHAFDLISTDQKLWKDHILPVFDFAQNYVEVVHS